MSQFGSWKDSVERRRWEKTFHVLRLFSNTAKPWEVSTWQTCCYHCIEYRARQSTGTKDILASYWYGKDQCLDPIQSSLSSEWETTQGSEIFAPIQSWAIRCSNSCQQSESIQFKKTALKTKKFEGTYHEEKAYSGIACHRCSFWLSRTWAKPYYQQKSMQIMQYDVQNAMFQMQDLSVFTGWLQLFCWFPYRTVFLYWLFAKYKSFS